MRGRSQIKRGSQSTEELTVGRPPVQHVRYHVVNAVTVPAVTARLAVVKGHSAQTRSPEIKTINLKILTGSQEIQTGGSKIQTGCPKIQRGSPEIKIGSPEI